MWNDGQWCGGIDTCSRRRRRRHVLVEELAAAVCADAGDGHLRRHAGAEPLLSDVLGDVIRPESARTLYGVAIDLEAPRRSRGDVRAPRDDGPAAGRREVGT
jgi:hypothetical protein